MRGELMEPIKLVWPEFKALLDLWKIASAVRFTPKDASGLYSAVWCQFDGKMFEVTGGLDATSADGIDFETNYLPLAVIAPRQVSTQSERVDIDLKMARCGVDIVNGTGTIYVQAPTLRYAGGGYLKLDTYDIDDHVLLSIEDKDRLIAAAMGGLTDEQVIASGAFPQYPTVKSYTDEEQPEECRGWYFDPKPLGGSAPAMGECQIDPIGFYGELPAGMWVKCVIVRPNVQIGKARCDLFWGKSEK